MKYLIKNVRLFDPSLNLDEKGSLLIEAGKIKALGSVAEKEANEVFDGQGHLLTPGLVDLHVHLREPGFEHKETIETGTRAAAAGGFTTVCCMANTQPVNDEASVTHYILQKARESASVRVWPIGAITKGLQGKDLANIGELQEAGCVAISDDGMTVMNAQVMRLAMEYASGFGLPVITHSVDANLSAGGAMNEGVVSQRLGIPGIPAQAEDIIVARDIELVSLTGCHLHVAHVSTAGAVELIRQAKKRQLPVSGEAAPHHWSLTEEACEAYQSNAKMCPPLRTEKDRQAVIAGLADGTLEVMATDHAPHAAVDKEVEFDEAAFGITGLETAFALAYRLVLEKQLSLAQVIKAFTQAPLKVLGKSYQGLQVGAPADLALFDLEKKWTYEVEKTFSKSRNSPFEGWNLQGKVLSTWVEGKKVF
ncbi:MAG: dihydroorotase [Deltaproteobacteria bacterium]|nr:dihydroorotase [Deltaproteobacteria bacterium]